MDKRRHFRPNMTSYVTSYVKYDTWHDNNFLYNVLNNKENTDNTYQYQMINYYSILNIEFINQSLCNNIIGTICITDMVLLQIIIQLHISTRSKNHFMSHISESYSRSNSNKAKSFIECAHNKKRSRLIFIEVLLQPKFSFVIMIIGIK